jgi:hypothetical protein
MGDKTSSLAYYKTEQDGAPVNGKWKSAGHLCGGTSSFEFTTGTTTTDETMTQKTIETTMSESMTFGWEFNNATVEHSKTEGLTEATTSAIEQSYEKKVTIDCDYMDKPYCTALY